LIVGAFHAPSACGLLRVTATGAAGVAPPAGALFASGTMRCFIARMPCASCRRSTLSLTHSECPVVVAFHAQPSCALRNATPTAVDKEDTRRRVIEGKAMEYMKVRERGGGIRGGGGWHV